MNPNKSQGFYYGTIRTPLKYRRGEQLLEAGSNVVGARVVWAVQATSGKSINVSLHPVLLIADMVWNCYKRNTVNSQLSGIITGWTVLENQKSWLKQTVPK